MKEVISFLMILPFYIYFIFQPTFNHIAHLEQMYLDIVINEGIEKAAVEGRFSQEIVQKMKQDVSENLNFPEDEISFEGTQVITPRGEYLWGKIAVPDQQFSFLPSLFGNDSKRKFYGYSTQMSEYLKRDSP